MHNIVIYFTEIVSVLSVDTGPSKKAEVLPSTQFSWQEKGGKHFIVHLFSKPEIEFTRFDSCAFFSNCETTQTSPFWWKTNKSMTVDEEFVF